MGSSMAFIDSSAVTLALEAIQEDLDSGFGAMLWVANAYTLTIAALVLIGGAMGDIFGRRVIFCSGVVTFAVSSLVCALSSSAELLIAGRAAQGVGAALLTPTSLAMLAAAYPREIRGRALGAWSAASAITMAIGPPVGGILVDVLSWRWIFLINLPLAVGAFTLTLWKAPPSNAPRALESIDWLGAILAFLGLGLIAFGFISWAEGRLPGHVIASGIVAGLVFMVGFFYAETKVKSPMAAPHLLMGRSFTGISLFTFLIYGAGGGLFIFFPYVLIEAHGHQARDVAIALLPFVVSMALLSRWAGGLTDRYGPRPPLMAGPLICCVSFAMMGLGPFKDSLWLGAAPAMAVFGVGMSMTVPCITSFVFKTASEDEAGAAAGVNNAVGRAAALFAIAGFGVIAAGAFKTASKGQEGLAEAGFGRSPDADMLSSNVQLAEAYSNAVESGFAAVTVAAIAFCIASSLTAMVLLPRNPEGKAPGHARDHAPWDRSPRLVRSDGVRTAPKPPSPAEPTGGAGDTAPANREAD